MTDKIEDISERLAKKYLGKAETESEQEVKKRGLIKRGLSKAVKSFGSFMSNHPKATKSIALSTFLGIVGVTAGMYFFGVDYLTKRQPFPIRNVMYQCNEQVTYYEEDIEDPWAERETEASIYGGSSIDTKIESVLGRFKFVVGKDNSRYEIQDQNNKRLVSSFEKWEAVQSGMSFTGTREFCDRNAVLINHDGKFVTYTIIPERGFSNIELTMLVEQGKEGRFVNEVVTHREPWILGIFLGEKFRAMTEVKEFIDTKNNQNRSRILHELIRDYNSPSTTSRSSRVKLIDKIREVLGDMESQPVVTSYEDGLFDWFPQESSTYLFLKPSVWQRMRTWGPSNTDVTTKTQPLYPNLTLLNAMYSLKIHNEQGKVIKLRVENQWDLWPGNYWLLNKISFGEPPHDVKPFSHRNNGGYTIVDSHGAIARVVIKDFILHYGNDLLYEYYLDKNADGVITDNELIGTVLFREDQIKSPISQDPQRKASSTFIYNFTFMSGQNREQRNEEFYLCYTIETFMINELNRGFGKHSDLGLINAQRSSILLLEHLNVPNLSRALTPESALVLKYDIRALLQAAGRTYVNDFLKEK